MPIQSLNNSQLKHSELTGRIIGCAMEVHSILGKGFLEVIYQRALEYELQANGIEYQREAEMDVWYKEQIIGKQRVDFLIGPIVVELKATTQLEPQHFAQALNYLESFKLDVGLLINFGGKSLEYHRLKNKT
jgi:GxxExxY protein